MCPSVNNKSFSQQAPAYPLVASISRSGYTKQLICRMTLFVLRPQAACGENNYALSRR